jgi:hypothetical protein
LYIFGPRNIIKEYLWHEISHLIINDLTKTYIDQFDMHGKEVSDEFRKNLYTNVETVINEYIIRAITIRLFEMSGENSFAKHLIKNNIQRGFKKTEMIKKYIMESFEEENKFVKDNRYKELIKYVIGKI